MSLATNGVENGVKPESKPLLKAFVSVYKTTVQAAVATYVINQMIKAKYKGKFKYSGKTAIEFDIEPGPKPEKDFCKGAETVFEAAVKSAEHKIPESKPKITGEKCSVKLTADEAVYGAELKVDDAESAFDVAANLADQLAQKGYKVGFNYCDGKVGLSIYQDDEDQVLSAGAWTQDAEKDFKAVTEAYQTIHVQGENQWASMTIVNNTGVDLHFSNIQIQYGDLSPKPSDGTGFTNGSTMVLKANGWWGKWEGCQANFDLATQEGTAYTFYYGCPWTVNQQNVFDVVSTGAWYSQNSGANFGLSGPLGNISIKLVRVPHVNIAAEKAVSYATIDNVDSYLEELVKDYPKELESSKAEALQLAKIAHNDIDISGSTWGTLVISKTGLLTLTAKSVGVRFIAQVNTQLWSTGNVDGMYYFDQISYSQNPYDIQISFTPKNTLITWSKNGQPITRFFNGGGYPGAGFTSVQATGNFVGL